MPAILEEFEFLLETKDPPVEFQRGGEVGNDEADVGDARDHFIFRLEFSSEHRNLWGMKLRELSGFLDTYLRVAEIQDWPNAHNGLQIQNSGEVLKIAAAVDACEYTIQEAAEQGANFLLVHHGMLWNGAQKFVGGVYNRLKTAITEDVAVYSAHLPLDMHPVVGNNVILGQLLGLQKTQPFLFERNQWIGVKARTSLPVEELVDRVEAAVEGPVRLIPGGPSHVRFVGVVTGGAGSEIQKAKSEGVDTFITGEGPHWTFAAAEELGINVIYAGHYATEVFGVKALAAHVAKKFRMDWTFIDHPSGL